MAEKKTQHTEVTVDNGAEPIEQLKQSWSKNGKTITYVLVALVALIGGYFGYQQFVKKPQQQEAVDKMAEAQRYYGIDSFALAVNGDGVHAGFAKLADQFGGIANYYAGVCYIKLGQNDKAVKYLKDFSTDSKPVQQRAYKLLGDAYGDLGKGKEALDAYKKAASYFTEDKAGSADALFSAAYLAQHILKDDKQAIELYKELKEKYSRTQQGFEAEKYLAQLGVYNVN